MDFATLEQCMQLRDAHIVSAVSSSEAMEALLTRFAVISAPGKGAPIVLAALARLGTTACDWIDGELRIEIVGDEAQTKIAISTSLGDHFREKIFPDVVLRVPVEEFSRGIKRAPRLIEPLQVKESGKRIVLSISQEVRKTSLPPPMVKIDPESLMELPETVPMVPMMAVPLDVPSNVLPMAPPADSVAPAAKPGARVVLRRREPPTEK